MKRTLLRATCAALLASCAGGTRTMTMVVIDADPSVRASTTALLVRVEGKTADAASYTSVRADQTVIIDRNDEHARFPFELPLVPLEGDDTRLFRVTVRAYTNDQSPDVATPSYEARAISGYLGGAQRVLRMRLFEACGGTACGESETCLPLSGCVSAERPVGALEHYTSGYDPEVIARCDEDDTCAEGATCNASGCTCPTGYGDVSGDGRVCVDGDSCLAQTTCDAYVCEDGVGTFTCGTSCGAGFVEIGAGSDLVCSPTFLSAVLSSGPLNSTTLMIPTQTSFGLQLGIFGSRVRVTYAVADSSISLFEDGALLPTGGFLDALAVDDNTTTRTLELRASRNGVDRDFSLNLSRVPASTTYGHWYGKAASVDVSDEIGRSVAVDEATARIAVGRPGDDSAMTGVQIAEPADDGSVDTGAVNVYDFDTGMLTFVPRATLKAPQVNTVDRFGDDVAIEGDVIVVGAPGEDGSAASTASNHDELATDAGAAYVYRRFQDTYVLEAYLKAPNAGAGDEFGRAVAIHGDFIVVGAPYEDGSAASTVGTPDEDVLGAGAAYVYRRVSGAWTHYAYLKAETVSAQGSFGLAVAVYGDTFVVGEPYGNMNRGHAHVFRAAPGGAAARVVTLANPTPANEDAFGIALDLSATHLVVGAPYEDSLSSGCNAIETYASDNDVGAVFIFERAGPGFGEPVRLKPGHQDPTQSFGRSVAISGGTLLVGAPGDDRNATNVVAVASTSAGTDLYDDYGAVWAYVIGEGVPCGFPRYVKGPAALGQHYFGRDVDVGAGFAITSAPGDTGQPTGVIPNGTPGVAIYGPSGAFFVMR